MLMLVLNKPVCVLQKTTLDLKSKQAGELVKQKTPTRMNGFTKWFLSPQVARIQEIQRTKG